MARDASWLRSIVAWVLLAVLPSSLAAQPARRDGGEPGLERFSLIKPGVIADPGQDPLLVYPGVSNKSAVKVRANQLIVSFRALDAEASRNELVGIAGLSIIDEVPGRAVFLVRAATKPGLLAFTPAEVAAMLGMDEEIARGEVVVDAPILFTLADNQSGVFPYEFEPWHFLNLGRDPDSQENDADIDAEEALGRLANGTATQPSPIRPALVAVIDSGVNPIHPALAPALWVNPREIPGNGRDDDQNGYKDDINGWNFADNNALLQDPSGHGTHVSGIIAAQPTGKPVGPRGVAPNARLVIAKLAFTSDKETEAFPIVKAVYYATDLRVDVINMSLKSTEGHIQALKDAIYAASLADVAVVAAAGNDGFDLSVTPVYPCVYEYMVLCVAATDAKDRLASFSNYHPSLRMIAAPGASIFSTLPGGQGEMSGTSMATPLVAGAIAGMRSLYPDLTVARLHGRLLAAADSPRTLVGKMAEPKRLNLYRAYFAPRASYAAADDGYCDERVPDPHSPQQTYPRWTNYPYANSGEPGIDGTSYARAFALCTARQMIAIRREDLDKVFVLRRHIDWMAMEPVYRQQIGAEVTTGGTIIYPFQGIFDGNGFDIRGLTFEGPRPTGGLFGELGTRSLVTNLRLTDALIAFKRGGGILAPKAAGRIVNVEASGKVRGEMIVGGLVGQLIGGTIEGSFVDAAVSGEQLVGGIAGIVGQTFIQPGSPLPVGAILRSRFQGRIAGTRAGGLAGWANNGVIGQSYAHVENDGASAATVGGLVGQLSCGGRIEDSYAEARLGGNYEIGGLVGLLVSAKLVRSFAAAFVPSVPAGKVGAAIGLRDDRRTNSIDSTPPLYLCTATTSPSSPSSVEAVSYNRFFSEAQGGGGTGLSDAQMRAPASYPTFSADVWELRKGRYPLLTKLPRSTAAND